MKGTIANPSETDEDVSILLRKVLGSCNINFLFGAGANGKAFPSFSGFKKTIAKMNKLNLPGKNIETALQTCTDDNTRQVILKSFVDEYNSFNGYQLDNPSIQNLHSLLSATYKTVCKAENRHADSKRVNVFTLNYDRIVEETLETSGYFSYVLNAETKTALPFNIVGYDTEKRSFVPTFAIYKLHGSVKTNRTLSASGIVFPGQDKLGSVISEFYETLFAMKGELLKKNAALFVIGYSWSDAHINGVISDAIDNGLTVIFPKYSEHSEVDKELQNKVICLPPALHADGDDPHDTTKTLAELFEKAIS